jgi:ankyrin repeat protein
VARLAPLASDRERRGAFVLAALNGRAEALRRMIALGVDLDAPADDLYAHGTPLHHAVCSGNLEAVKELVESGARLDRRDTLWHGTPLEWAEHYVEEHGAGEGGARYAEIAQYLQRAAVRGQSANVRDQ